MEHDEYTVTVGKILSLGIAGVIIGIAVLACIAMSTPYDYPDSDITSDITFDILAYYPSDNFVIGYDDNMTYIGFDLRNVQHVTRNYSDTNQCRIVKYESDEYPYPFYKIYMDMNRDVIRPK